MAIVLHIVQQHTDDAAALAMNRPALTNATYARLDGLRRADLRLRAHLEGLKLGGPGALALAEAALETPSASVVFPLAISALEGRDRSLLDRLFALAQALPNTVDGLLCAFGWMERSRLQGIVAALLRDADGFKRMLGLAACAIHRVDPGIATGPYLKDADPAVRARAFRAVGELGLSDLLPSCVAVISNDDEPEVQFWAAWSAVLLGDRRTGLDVLMKHALVDGTHQSQSFQLGLQAMGLAGAHVVLRDLPRDAEGTRRLIQGSSIVGDPAYVPWLIKHMSDLKKARLAGEAFALIAGVDMGVDALDSPAPENFESGPNDDPDDPNVDMDPDDGSSWPDAEKIEKWWASNAGRFQKGTRYFVGAPVTWEHCLDVLKNGYQRQRILAAHYLCLLNPGTPLFNTSAPAWRQQQQLAKIS